MYAILSRTVASVSSGIAPFSSSTWLVRHVKGPRTHNIESNNTDRLPDTAIWPWKVKSWLD